jgi:myo-inositol 2-dehydrogenase/D-chiro-inositol 1-dehydrogenase
MRIGLIGVGRIGAFHAATLRDLPGVDAVTVADADPARAREVAGVLGVEVADGVDALFAGGLDGVVVTAATSAHAELVHRALDERIPVFCEKPVALDVPATRAVVAHAAASAAPVQVGFQRRFDTGYRAARAALRSGELGWLHTLRAVTADQSPPPAAYLPKSGGLFRDCCIHDFDIMRWLTGRQVVSVQAAGGNRGAAFFAAADDVDTCAALLRFDDDMLATVTATRYNGAGHDVRLEVCGSAGTLVVGLDDRAPLPSAEPALSWRPTVPPYRNFLERFHDAYVAELTGFVTAVATGAGSPCGPDEALEALYVAEACEISRRRGRAVEIDEVREKSG